MPQSRPWRVLIIEDELVDREIYKGYLQPASSFECAEAASAAAGIAMCREWAPDCVLLDYNLPDMDGLEVLPQLGVSAENPRCAVVMLTAFGGDLAVQAMKSGAMDYLPKGQLAADVLPNTIIGAIQRFQVQQRIHEQRSAFEESALKRETLLEAIPQMVWACNAEGNVEYVNRAWFEYTGIAMEQAGRLGWDRLLHPDDQERTWNSWNTAVREGSLFEIEHRLKRALDGSYQWHLSRAVPIRGEHGEVTNWFGTCTVIENQKQAEKLAIQREKQEGIGRLAAGVAHDFNNLLVAVLGGAVYALDSLPPSHPAQNMLKGVVRAGERAATLTGKMLAYAGKGNLNVEQIDLNQLVRETCESMRSSLQKTVRLKVKAAGTAYFLMADSRQMRQVIVDLVLNAAKASLTAQRAPLPSRPRTWKWAKVGKQLPAIMWCWKCGTRVVAWMRRR